MRRTDKRSASRRGLRPPLLPYPALLELAEPGSEPFVIKPGTTFSIGEGIAQEDPSALALKALLAQLKEGLSALALKALLAQLKTKAGAHGAPAKAGAHGAPASCGAAACGSIALRLRANSSAGPESYNLRITSEAVELDAPALPGLFYGVQTLRQLVSSGEDSEGGAEWPALTISDAPRFAWRGLHVDVSRHFFPAERLKKMLDVMAMFKMNRLHWHLTDDQGWRLPVDGYPKLTEIDGQGEAYTKEEIKDLVAHAQALHIEVVPEIDVPGHVEAALAAYPDLGNTDVPNRTAPTGPRKEWGISDYTLAPNDATWAFLSRVFDTVVELFPSQLVHIGGDEVRSAEWARSAAAMSFLGMSSSEKEASLESGDQQSPGDRVGAQFTNKVVELLKARGRRTAAWDEAQHREGFPADGIVIAWRSADEAALATQAGRQTVVADAGVLYFDHAQAQEGEPEAQPGGCTSWQQVYDYDPMPANLTKAEQKLVLGAQGQLWSEYIPTWQHMEYMAYPRSLALAERTWTPPSRIQSVEEFEERLMQRVGDLDHLGVNYRRPDLIGCVPINDVALQSEAPLPTEISTKLEPQNE